MHSQSVGENQLALHADSLILPWQLLLDGYDHFNHRTWKASLPTPAVQSNC